MTDPRNIAHDKKVQQEKEHRGIEVAPDAEKTPQPGKKPHLEHHASDSTVDSENENDQPASK